MRRLKDWFAPGRTGVKFTPPELPLDALGAGFLADPTPTWAWLRDNAPLAPMKSGGYVLTRADDIRAAFTDPRLGNAPSRFSMLATKNRDKYTAANVAANIPPFLDKPRHVEMRKPLSAAFFDSFDGVEGWLPAMAVAHLEALKGAGEVDLITRYGRPYATEAMARFVGLPHDPDAIARATGALFRLFAPIVDRAGFAQVNAELEQARALISQAVRAKRDAPGDDLITHLSAGGALAETEIADHALLMLADGIENIEAAIAQVLWHFEAFPEWRHAIAEGADPAGFVAEVLRMETPAQMIPRVVRDAHERDGVTLAEGTPIFLALGSANRDPSLHPDPDRFDPTRDPSQLILFGLGRHRCIGAPLGQKLVAEAARAMAGQDIAFTQTGHFAYQPRLGHRWPLACPAYFD